MKSYKQKQKQQPLLLLLLLPLLLLLAIAHYPLLVALQRQEEQRWCYRELLLAKVAAGKRQQI